MVLDCTCCARTTPAQQKQHTTHTDTRQHCRHLRRQTGSHMDKTQQTCEVCCGTKKGEWGCTPRTPQSSPHTTRRAHRGPQGGSPTCVRQPCAGWLHAGDHHQTTIHTTTDRTGQDAPLPPPNTAPHPCRQGTWQCSGQTRKTAAANAVLVCGHAQPCTAYRPDHCSAATTPTSPPKLAMLDAHACAQQQGCKPSSPTTPKPLPKTLPTGPEKAQLWTPCRHGRPTNHTTTKDPPPPPRLAAKGNVHALHPAAQTIHSQAGCRCKTTSCSGEVLGHIVLLSGTKRSTQPNSMRSSLPGQGRS